MLRFVIDCSCSAWNPAPGATLPEGAVFEARAVPGGLIGCGHTLSEARENLERLLAWTIRDEPSPEAWYKEAWEKACPEDVKLFGRRMVQEARKIESAPIRSTGGAGGGTEYSALGLAAC